MNLTPSTQTKLLSFDKIFTHLIFLYENQNLPNKILFSGNKGIGKATLAFHLINYILSKEEDHPYDQTNLKIDINNRSYKLTQNKSHPNFICVDILDGKKFIDIEQIRNMISRLEKSSFNNKPRFILIDNIELLNLNSINAILKILEEPSENIFFILINNNKRNVLPTLKSRCLNYNLSLSYDETISISNKLIDTNINDLIHHELIDYYITPGKIYNLIKFSKENNINLKDLDLKNFLKLIVDNSFHKKDDLFKLLIYDFIEIFLLKEISLKHIDFFSYFLKKINDVKKFNLDEESFFLEFKSKLLNG